MSITKFENAEGKLMSQVDIDSKNLSANSSQCFCINCDSVGCFEKRKKAVKDSCQCGICVNLRKSSFLHNKASRKTKNHLENATKKKIREVVTRETVQSLKRVTETMYEFGTNANFETITKRQSKLSDKKEIPTPKISQISITCCNKRSTGNSEIITKKENCKQKPIVQIPSTYLCQPCKEGNTTTKLSAQVMNVPYEDLHETVSSSRELTEQNPLSKLNLFKRIKEIYEACSCKVCECISSKPRDTRDDICECKPCQCQDCVKLKKKIEENIRRIPHSGCPCIRCDRKDCRGIAKTSYEPQICDCNPSDSVQYPVNLIKSCKCEPCQCINCRLLGLQTPKTVRLRQVDEFMQRETCQCSPCECIECKQIYNRTNPTVMYTHATDMNKYRNYNGCYDCRTKRTQLVGKIDTCKCDRHNNKIMEKTVLKNYNDYDIRTVIVDNNGPFNKPKCEFIKQNTIALFASLENTYPNNTCNKDICKCTDCECMICSGKDDSLRKYRDNFRHNVMSVHNGIKLSTSITNACKCSPCECEICSKKGEHEAFDRKCICEVCDCLNCDNVSLATSPVPSSSAPHQYIDERRPAKSIRSIEMNKNCDCNSCDCSNCKKLFSCSSSVKFYSDGKSVQKKTRRLRKVLLITPSTSESHLKTRKTYVQNVSSTTLSPKQSIADVYRQNLSSCHAVSQNYGPVGHLSSTNKNEVCQLYQDSNVTSDDDAYGEMFFKLNNPILDITSLKSIEETPIINDSCDYNQSAFKTHNLINQSQIKRNEAECKSFFNIIHEQSDKITSNVSDESLPVYWTCCNGSSYPKSYCRNIKITCKRTKSIPINDTLNNTKCSKNKQVEEKPKEKTIDQILVHKSKSDDAFCDDERVKLQQESYEYTDSYISTVNENQQRYRKSVVNLSDFTMDYERATIVLREAKAFSSKLIKMLDSFETANRQFESASQKFKVLHESLLDINESELDKTYSTNLRKSSRPIFENTFRIISEVNHDNQSTDERIKDENEAESEYEQSTNKPNDVDDNFEYIENSSTHYISETKSITKLNNIDSIININMIHQLSSKSQFQIFDKIDVLPTTKTSQIQIFGFSNHDSRGTDFNIEDINQMENKNDEINKQTPTIASVVKKLDSIYGNVITTNTAVATDDVEKNPVQLSEQEDKQLWQIFKKNLYLTADPINKRTLFESPALELDIKEAIQAISLQTTKKNYGKVVPRPNEALAHLQTEVNDLLNMPILQINSQFECKAESDAHFFPRTKLDLEVKSLSSTASSQTYNRVIERADKEVYFNIDSQANKASCDQLKATFVGLKRVSDHTVLVKWAVPKRIADVQGYELLVDGRAVQKIFSPTRNMAVVTCLPHATRVLLTVRTIAAADCGHAPTSTIVYRPRMK